MSEVTEEGGWWEGEGLRFCCLRYIGDGREQALQREEQGALGWSLGSWGSLVTAGCSRGVSILRRCNSR